MLATEDFSEISEKVSAARLAMRRQTGPGGGMIVVEPRTVLVPPELETSTQKTLTAIQAMQTADVNPLSFLTLAVESRLTDTARWYLWSDSIVSLEYAYLSGAPGPQTESRSGWEVDGLEVKLRLDFGAGFTDHRGVYSNAGK